MRLTVFIVLAVFAASLLLAACGDDDGGGNGNGGGATNTPGANGGNGGGGSDDGDRLSEEEYFPRLTNAMTEAAEGLDAIDRSLPEADRYNAAADLFNEMADSIEPMEPPISVAVVQDAYVDSIRRVAEGLSGLAAGTPDADTTLENGLLDLEFVCKSLDATADFTLPEGAELDCDLGQGLPDSLN